MNLQKLPRTIGTVAGFCSLHFHLWRSYTTETLIHSVGPGLGLLILALLPLIWSVPEALIVGELTSMSPEEDGYYRWVDRAFGRFWAFQHGWLTLMYSLVDMAIYPVLLYLRGFIPGLDARVEWLHLACHYVGRNIDQRPRLSECHSYFNYLWLPHHARLSCLVSRECAAHYSHSMATVCLGIGSRTRRLGRRYLDCALELHRVR